jgi:hypothetical protein
MRYNGKCYLVCAVVIGALLVMLWNEARKSAIQGAFCHRSAVMLKEANLEFCKSVNISTEEYKKFMRQYFSNKDLKGHVAIKVYLDYEGE